MLATVSDPGFAFISRSPPAMRGGRAAREASLDFIRATTFSSPLPRTKEGAERRETLVRIAAPFACHDAARGGHLTRRPAPSNVGRPPLGASPQRLTIPARRLTPEASASVIVPSGGFSGSPERESCEPRPQAPLPAPLLA